MAKERNNPKHEKIVKTYFSLIQDLYDEKEGTVERLLELWDDDGTFEFIGTPPTTASFQGKNAIHVLYKNRIHSNRMNLTLEGGDAKNAKVSKLGELNTGVFQRRAVGDKIIADWTKYVTTDDGRGFTVSGSHTFAFRDEKISNLKVVVSPKAHATEGFRLEGLSVNDIGRLSLAAWAVV